MRAAVRTLWLGLVGAMLVGGCGPRPPRDTSFRLTSEHYYFTVSSVPTPPHARERVLYKVLVRDKESRQPIETGEGRIYSSNRDMAQTWDGFVKAPEPGAYTGTLNFVASGQWAIAIEFRRDSTSRVEKVEWMQDVLGARDQ